MIFGHTYDIFCQGNVSLHYTTKAEAFIQSEVQNGAFQGQITNNQRRRTRYNSYRIGCKAMNICPVHKVDGPSQLPHRDDYNLRN